MKYALRPLEEGDLETVLRWRNTDRIRNSMYNNEIINLEQHQKWFKKISSSQKDYYFIFTINHTETGLVSFNDVDFKNNHCYWGFYIGEAEAPSGSGTVMGYLALEWAFQQLKIGKVYGEVLLSNKTSILYHQKLGFCKEGHFRKHLQRDGQFHDILRYGLLMEEWLISKPIIQKN